MRTWKFLFIAVTCIFFASCNTKNSVTPIQNVFFFLSDDPALQDYQLNFSQVNIEVKEVDYVAADSSITKVPITDQVYNLKSYMNGNCALLSQITLPFPNNVSIKQVRLVLGSNNSVMLENGTLVPLTIPNGQQSGITFNVDETVPATLASYSIIIDFNIGSSILATDNDSYQLNPVVRSYVADVTSYINGNIHPANLLTKVFVVNGPDTIWTVSDTTRSNYFRLSGLPTGTYTVQFMPFDTTVVTNTASATVKGGSYTNLDTIKITN